MMSSNNKIQAIKEIRQFYNLSDKALSNLEQFVDLLLTHNQSHNLIGNSTIENLWQRHILDSAQLLKYIDNKNLITGDFGSGAGFPALVLSILGLKEVHLIEKSFRKCQFLELAKKFSDNKIVIHQKDVEELSGIKFDLIISRAFAPMDRLLTTIKPFAKKETIGIFLKGKNLTQELVVAKKLHQFTYETYPSITSEESAVIIIKNFIN
jgi:16S rRNA (guanine527-N7)-methyltransferase